MSPTKPKRNTSKKAVAKAAPKVAAPQKAPAPKLATPKFATPKLATPKLATPKLATKEKPIALPSPAKVRRSGESEREVHALEPSQLTRSERPQVVVAGQTDGNEGRYVYGVIQTKEPMTFGKIGMGGSGEMVYTVHHGDIAGIVSKSPVFIFDPTRENALAHEHVIETVMKAQTIIPMSFGTVFRTDDDIREVLKSIYPSLKDVLKQMSNKLEFGSKVTWDRDQIIEELKRQHEDIHRSHHEIATKHPAFPY